jgi:hypothetical protein
MWIEKEGFMEEVSHTLMERQLIFRQRKKTIFSE